MRRVLRALSGAAVAVAGCAFLSLPLLLWPMGIELAPDRRWMPGPPSLALVAVVAVACALVSVVLGVVLALRGQRSFGAGLVAGWLLLGAVTQGWCVGLAPELFDPERHYRPYVDSFSTMPRPEAERRAEAELRSVLALKAAGEAPSAFQDVERQGDCWTYDDDKRDLVEPSGSGVVEFATTLTTAQGQAQASLDRIATELSRRYRATGRKYEAAFESREGFVVRLLAREGDTGLTITVHTPCLRDLGSTS